MAPIGRSEASRIFAGSWRVLSHAAAAWPFPRGEPLVFRTWAKGQLLERGVWNVPVPTKDAEVVVPDVVIAPVVGFDRSVSPQGSWTVI